MGVGAAHPTRIEKAGTPVGYGSRKDLASLRVCGRPRKSSHTPTRSVIRPHSRRLNGDTVERSGSDFIVKHLGTNV